MKKKILLLFLLVSSIPAKAQINLVLNPSFEDTISCPDHLNNMYEVRNWSSFGHSADYFNACGSGAMNVPNAAAGFQYANTGKAYCGVITYLKGNNSDRKNYREYIGSQLLTTLTVGVKYYFSFFAVSGQHNSTIGFFSNNIGLRFFTRAYDELNPAPLDNFSHIKYDNLLTDTVYWQRVSGSFIADSNYQYVCIGNFYDANHTDTLIFSTEIPFSAYNYIDDVCVTTDSLYNLTWTGHYQPIEPNTVQIYPNPVQDYFQYKSKQKIDEIIVYDSRGILLKRESVNALEGRINLSTISEGIYIAAFRNGNGITINKFVIVTTQ